MRTEVTLVGRDGEVGGWWFTGLVFEAYISIRSFQIENLALWYVRRYCGNINDCHACATWSCVNVL